MDLNITVKLPDEAEHFFDYIGNISTALCLIAHKLTADPRLGTITPDEAFTEMVKDRPHVYRPTCEADEHQTPPEVEAESAEPAQNVPNTEAKAPETVANEPETVALDTVKKLALTLMRMGPEMSAKVANIVHQKGEKISALADNAEALTWVYGKLQELSGEAA